MRCLGYYLQVHRAAQAFRRWTRKFTRFGGNEVEALAIVTVLMAMQAFLFAFQVGQARVRSRISAPSCVGSEEFERANRVHQNTIEQLVVVLPSLWIFGLYVHDLIGAGLGALFIIGRFVYRNSYVRDPSTRSAGFAIGAVVFLILAVGGLIGAGIEFFGL